MKQRCNTQKRIKRSFALCSGARKVAYREEAIAVNRLAGFPAEAIAQPSEKLHRA